MLSHVVEFSCQYSEQVRKKQKVWHDGKLKHYQINNRFLLYTDDGVLLSSIFVTNTKELKVYVDEENFGTMEHSIFGRFVVIIEEIIAEYDREISHIKTATTTTAVTSTNVNSAGTNNQEKENQDLNNGNFITRNKSINNAEYYSNKIVLKAVTKNTMVKKVEASSPLPTPFSIAPNVFPKRISMNMTKISSRTRSVDLNETGRRFSTPNLALKVNKPFKPPRIVSNINNVSNRPNIRNSRVNNEIVDSTLVDKNNTIKNGKTANGSPLLKVHGAIIQEASTVKTSDEYVKHTNNNIFKESSAIKQKISEINFNKRPFFKTKMINHTPIILP